MLIQKIDVKSVMTKSNLPVADYSVNPYVGCSHGCKYCYASFMKRFTNHPEPWGSFVDVKYWLEIKNPAKYAGKEAFIGSVTDPYQPCEAKYQRTRALLEQLQGSGQLRDPQHPARRQIRYRLYRRSGERMVLQGGGLRH